MRSRIAQAAYEPHEDDPLELLVECPACKAKVGAWCGGFLDIHEERTAALEAQIKKG